MPVPKSGDSGTYMIAYETLKLETVFHSIQSSVHTCYADYLRL